MPSTTFSDPTPDCVGQYMKETMFAPQCEKSNLVSVIESEISTEAENLPHEYSSSFKEIADILKRISPGRYEGSLGYRNLIIDLRELIDKWVRVTDVLGKDSIKRIKDEDQQWLVRYLVRCIIEILDKMKDNLFSYYYSNKGLGNYGQHRVKILSYLVEQVLDIVELYHLWDSISSPHCPEPEEILDRIGQKLYASENRKL